MALTCSTTRPCRWTTLNFHCDDYDAFNIIRDCVSIAYQVKISRNTRSILRRHFYEKTGRYIASYVQKGLTIVHPGVIHDESSGMEKCGAGGTFAVIFISLSVSVFNYDLSLISHFQLTFVGSKSSASWKQTSSIDISGLSIAPRGEHSGVR